MGLLRWLRHRTAGPPEPTTWTIERTANTLRVLAGEHQEQHAVERWRSIRVVPRGYVDPHGGRAGQGWQVASRRDDGDVPVGLPVQDGRAAYAFAQRLAAEVGVPMDELTEGLFRQVASREPGTEGA